VKADAWPGGGRGLAGAAVALLRISEDSFQAGGFEDGFLTEALGFAPRDCWFQSGSLARLPFS